METLETGLVIGANRYKVRNASGASLYMLQVNSGFNEQLTGLEVKKIDMSYAMFDQLKDKPLPSVYELVVNHSRGGQDEDRLSVTSITRKSDDLLISEINKLFPNLQAKYPKPVERGPMQSASVALLLSATCYHMEEEGAKGGRVYVAQQSDGKNPDQIGVEILKFRIPFELFAVAEQRGLPGEYVIGLHLERGGRDKGRYRVVSISEENTLDKERLYQIFGVKQERAKPSVPETKAA